MNTFTARLPNGGRLMEIAVVIVVCCGDTLGGTACVVLMPSLVCERLSFAEI